MYHPSSYTGLIYLIPPTSTLIMSIVEYILQFFFCLFPGHWSQNNFNSPCWTSTLYQIGLAREHTTPIPRNVWWRWKALVLHYSIHLFQPGTPSRLLIVTNQSAVLFVIGCLSGSCAWVKSCVNVLTCHPCNIFTRGVLLMQLPSWKMWQNGGLLEHWKHKKCYLK